jgi:hypothetical protein
MRTKSIALPQLDRVRPTMESTAIKLMEKAGELAHDCARELLDVAQTAVTLMFVLEEQYGVDVETALSEHMNKLVNKGYLSI